MVAKMAALSDVQLVDRLALPRVGWMAAWWVDSMVARKAAWSVESTADQKVRSKVAKKVA